MFSGSLPQGRGREVRGPSGKRSGRNRGSYLRKGSPNLGMGVLDDVLLAIAESQAVLGLNDQQFEAAAHVPHGTLHGFRRGRGYPSYIEKITDFLASKVPA